ncbi:MAG: hypothetical protein ACRDIE_18000 [Chloroflexota bacterium]
METAVHVPHHLAGLGYFGPSGGIRRRFLPLALAEAVLGHARYSEVTKPLTFFSLLAAAGTVWVVGRTLNGVPGRVLIDPATDQ